MGNYGESILQVCNCRRWIFPKRREGKPWNTHCCDWAQSCIFHLCYFVKWRQTLGPPNPKSINPQASGDAGGCPSWITLTSPAATTHSSVIAHVSFVCAWISAHLLRTPSDSSRSSPSGSPPRWWWCSRCLSSSGGHERRKTECVSAPPGWFSACRTAGRHRWEQLSFLVSLLLVSCDCSLYLSTLCI